MSSKDDAALAQVLDLLRQILAVQQQTLEALRDQRDQGKPVRSGPTTQQGN